MKKTTIVKFAGWVGMAILGVLVNWASDREAKDETEEKLSKLIAEQKNGED